MKAKEPPQPSRRGEPGWRKAGDLHRLVAMEPWKLTLSPPVRTSRRNAA